MNLRSIRIPAIYPARAATSVRPGTETPPTELGLEGDAADRIWAAVERLYGVGVNPAIALCVRHRGQVLLDRAIGHARGNAPGDTPDVPKVRATPDTPFCIFSASKAITAMVIHALDDRGLLHVDDPVASYIPGFEKHGKEWITIRHILTHRAGIPSIGDETQLDLLFDPELVVNLLRDARPDSPPGRRLAYHAISGGFVLGEIVRQVTGRDIRAVLRSEFLDPLGFSGMSYGCDASQVPHVAQSAFTGRPPVFPVDQVARRALGVSFDKAPAIGNSEAWLTSIVPAGNIVATANEACRFFEMLNQGGQLDGTRVMEARTIRRAVTETAYLEIDFTLGLPVRYGNGVMLGSERLGVFGPRTARAFGHLGFTNIFCWADPARDLSAALLTSGKPLVSRHLVALARLLSTVSSAIPELADPPRRF